VKNSASNVIATILIVAVALGILHLPEGIDNAKPAVVPESPVSIHPEDRPEEGPSDVRPLDRQKTNVATQSIAILQGSTDAERQVRKGSERVRAIELPSGGLSFPAFESANSYLLLIGLVIGAILAGIVSLTRRRPSLVDPSESYRCQGRCQTLQLQALFPPGEKNREDRV